MNNILVNISQYAGHQISHIMKANMRYNDANGSIIPQLIRYNAFFILLFFLFFNKPPLLQECGTSFRIAHLKRYCCSTPQAFFFLADIIHVRFPSGSNVNLFDDFMPEYFAYKFLHSSFVKERQRTDKVKVSNF